MSLYMKEAEKLAKKALKNNEVPVGAVVVRDGKIIGKGFNQQYKKNFYQHAEFNAIKKALKNNDLYDLRDCQLYVTLEPCLFCMGLILEKKIKKVVYGLKSPKDGFSNFIDIEKIKKRITIEEETNEESKKILKKFFQDKR